MHTTLDGFTSRTDGSFNWVTLSDEIWRFPHERIAVADTALYGRRTFDMMHAYWPTAGDAPDASEHDIEHSNWYNKVEKVVVSESMRGQHIDGVEIISDDVVEQITQLKNKPGGEIIMFGSPTLGAFLMQHNLIDDYWLFVNPIILGEGNSLYKGLKNEMKLKLAESNTLKSGVVALHYEKA